MYPLILIICKVLKGVEMEILDGAYPLLNSVTSGSDPKVMF